MKRTKKIINLIIMALSISLFLFQIGFAGSTATFTARCRMPEMISNKTLKQVDAQIENKEKTIKIGKEKDSSISQQNSNIVRKTEKVIVKETNEPQIITTVCAK